ncbi:MAG: branched-chain amino acid ABC transporter permease [Betaproteobacteria bacterium]|nr:branched-chain amino acid ABC transporter permease [Betaproteobacteria bacterium]
MSKADSPEAAHADETPERAVAFADAPDPVLGLLPWRRVAVFYLAGLFAAIAPMGLLAHEFFWVNILTYTYLFAGLAVAWNIIAGFGGQFSLGHGVFFAVGAYTTVRLFLDWHLTPWLGLLPGALICAVAGPLIFWPTFRLKGSFFAIATLAFNQVAFVFANYFDSLTGGPRGLQVPFRAGTANMIFTSPDAYAVLMFGFMAMALAIVIVLMRSRLGYYLLAVREDEDAARAAGISVIGVKLRATALSAALTAIGGGLFAMYIRTIDPPTLFSLPDIGVKFALLTLIGGMGTIAGPVLGAFLIVPLESYFRAALGGAGPGVYLILLGAVMIAAALFMRRGVAGAIDAVWQRWRPARKK